MLTVGVIVSDGAEPFPASSMPADNPSLPPLVRYEWVAADSGGPYLDNLCRIDPSPPVEGEPLWDGWWYHLTARSTATGDVLSTEIRCVPLPDPSDPTQRPDAPPLPTPPTIGEVWRSVALPAPTIHTSPPAWGVTGFESWLWTGGESTRTVEVELDGFRVTGTATLAGFWIDWGDALPVFVDAGGSADAPAATHMYERKGTYPLQVSALWRGEVVMTAPGIAAPQPVDIGAALVRSTRDYQVVEVVPELIR